jgi:hypothetical protein
VIYDDPKLTHDDCVEGPESCKGKVEYRYPLSATGRSFPRCDKHWSKRLDSHERQVARYGHPDSPFPPADFDPTYAGERWNEDD